MKKRCALLSLFLLISPFMIYSMEEVDDSETAAQEDETGIDKYHLTRYVEKKGWVDKDYLDELVAAEKKAKEKQEETYGGLLEGIDREDLSNEEIGIILSLTGVNLDKVIKKCRYNEKPRKFKEAVVNLAEKIKKFWEAEKEKERNAAELRRRMK